MVNNLNPICTACGLVDSREKLHDKDYAESVARGENIDTGACAINIVRGSCSLAQKGAQYFEDTSEYFVKPEDDNTGLPSGFAKVV